MPMPAMAAGCGGVVRTTGTMQQGQKDAVGQRHCAQATLSLAPAASLATASSAVAITEGATDAELQFSRDKVFLLMTKSGSVMRQWHGRRLRDGFGLIDVNCNTPTIAK